MQKDVWKERDREISRKWAFTNRKKERESQLQGQVKEEARVLYIVRPLHFLKDKKAHS